MKTISDILPKVITLFCVVFLFVTQGVSQDIIGTSSPSYKNCQTGSIDLEINGGIGPFEVEWYDNDNVLILSTGDIDGNDGEGDIDQIGAGDYRAVIIDANCGKAQINVIVEEKEALFEIEEVIYVDCDAGNGSIELNITSTEELTYEILWSNGVTESTISGLVPGTYMVTVTPNIGCPQTKEFTVNAYTYGLPEITPILKHACAIDKLGSIYMSNSILDPFDSWQWDDDEEITGNTRLNLSPGTYCLTALYINCEIQKCFDIYDFGFEAEVNTTDPICGEIYFTPRSNKN